MLLAFAVDRRHTSITSEGALDRHPRHGRGCHCVLHHEYDNEGESSDSGPDQKTLAI